MLGAVSLTVAVVSLSNRTGMAAALCDMFLAHFVFFTLWLGVLVGSTRHPAERKGGNLSVSITCHGARSGMYNWCTSDAWTGCVRSRQGAMTRLGVEPMCKHFDSELSRYSPGAATFAASRGGWK